MANPNEFNLFCTVTATKMLRRLWREFNQIVKGTPQRKRGVKVRQRAINEQLSPKIFTIICTSYEY